MRPGPASILLRKNEYARMCHQPGTGEGRADSPGNRHPSRQPGRDPCFGCLCQRSADAAGLSLSLQFVLFKAAISCRACRGCANGGDVSGKADCPGSEKDYPLWLVWFLAKRTPGLWMFFCLQRLFLRREPVGIIRRICSKLCRELSPPQHNYMSILATS